RPRPQPTVDPRPTRTAPSASNVRSSQPRRLALASLDVLSRQRRASTAIVSRPRHRACFFLFQAEDGIRGKLVTGVQTCALPISVERLAQQIALLDDPELGADYARVHHSFRQLADEIAQLPLDATQSAALASTVAQEQSLYGRLTESPRAQLAAGEITGHVDRLSDSAREVLAISNLLVDREVERLRFNAEHVQRSLILLVIFSTAVALSIALALTRYISRPIAEIDAAIRQLGGADFSRPIAVRGPADLRYLGRRLDWLRRRLDEFETQKNRFLRHVS